MSADFGPVEVVVNDHRYVREQTLFAALERVDILVAQRDALATVLRKTIYSPRGYSGQSPWWEQEARDALATIDFEEFGR